MPQKISAEQYQRLQAKTAKLAAEANKAQGAYEQLMARAREEYGISTAKEFRALVQQLETEAAAAEEALEAAVEDFESQWGERLL